MSSILNETGPEGALLLFLAGELSAEDRSEVERQLARDPAMQAELDRLRESEELLHARLASLDAATPLGAQEAAAVRNVSRVLRQRQARPLVAAQAGPVRQRRRIPRWAVNGAVAAAVVAAMVAVGVKMNGPRERVDEVVEAEDPYPDIDPMAQYAAESLPRYPREGAEEDAGPGPQVASVSYDQPLFDVPIIPPEGSPPQP